MWLFFGHDVRSDSKSGSTDSLNFPGCRPLLYIMLFLSAERSTLATPTRTSASLLYQPYRRLQLELPSWGLADARSAPSLSGVALGVMIGYERREIPLGLQEARVLVLSIVAGGPFLSLEAAVFLMRSDLCFIGLSTFLQGP